MIRKSTGIAGLNEMLEGGFPSGHAIAVVGSPGSGKTTFALQFIWDGLTKDELCMLISLEDEENKLVETASKYGWDFKRYIDASTLSLVKLDTADMSNMFARIKSELPRIIDSMGISRVVIDPVTILEMGCKSEYERRVYIKELCNTLSRTGATTLLINETYLDKQDSTYGVIEHVTDGVILLHSINRSDSSSVLHGIEVVKMAWIAHSKDIKPYEITSAGIKVHERSRIY